MLRESFYIFILLSLCLEYVLSQHSDAGFEYGKMPVRPVAPDRTRPSVRPVRPIRPVTNRPRPSLPSQGGSRYLRRRKPGKKNMDKAKLMEKMGDDYQVNIMCFIFYIFVFVNHISNRFESFHYKIFIVSIGSWNQVWPASYTIHMLFLFSVCWLTQA